MRLRLAPGLWFALGSWVGLGALAPVALADARVDVEVKDASGRLATGRVTLTAGATSKSCATVGGRCSVTLPGGTYQVRLEAGSAPPTTKSTTVPASGSIRLVLVIPAPTAAPPPSAPPPAAPPTTGTSTSSLSQPAATVRDLGKGRKLLVQGSVTDASGRLTNATINVMRSDGSVVGRSVTVGGRFNIYDLPGGTYRLVAQGPNGLVAQLSATVGTSLVRPTLRLAPARR